VEDSVKERRKHKAFADMVVRPEAVVNFDVEKYGKLVRMITHDLKDRYGRYVLNYAPRFTKKQIITFLAHPALHERELREAVRYVYDASPHFRRLIQYFAGLSDLAYVVSPYRIDPRKAKERIISGQYRKTLNQLSIMSIKTEFPKILITCLKEDVFYGTMWVSEDTITIQKLNPDCCKITSIEGNVCNVSFDFSYFDRFPRCISHYPDEFRVKYEQYKDDLAKGIRRCSWIELDSPTSFAIKCNIDILEYAIPPFAGILPEIFDIEGYKQIKMDGAQLENYAMLAMYIPYEDGEWGIDYTKAKQIWQNLDDVLPDQIGSVLTPMKLDKFSFEKSHNTDDDTVTEAEQSLFTAAGVSSLLFNNPKASAGSLLLSIKADQTITFGIVKSIEAMVNRYIQSLQYGKNFKVTFLDCSRFNQKELGDAYLKAASYGLPTISMYAASQGLGQAELDAMSFLETNVMKLHDVFKPLLNSAQVSSSSLDSEAPTDEGGAPQKDIGELTDAGEVSRERESDG
jgi:hypothetical protein